MMLSMTETDYENWRDDLRCGGQERTKSSPSGMHRLVQAATGKNNPPDDGRRYRPNHFRGITKMVAGTNTAKQGKEDSHEV